jgi:hypothetical protein
MGLIIFSDSSGDSKISRGWGFGFQNSSASEKKLNNSILFPTEFTYHHFQLRYIFAMPVGSFRVEIPFSLDLLRETSELNRDDEKYGYGLGLQLHYQLYYGFTAGLSYEKQYFAHGVNASSGERGSLAYPIDVSNLKFMLGYVISFGGLGSSGDSEGGDAGGDLE